MFCHTGYMATPLTVIAHDSLKKLRNHLTRVHDEGYRKRIRALIRLREGEPHGQVAKALGASRGSVCSWITKYNTGGISALVSNKGGRPEGNPKWDTKIFNDLIKEIDKGGYWSIPKMQAWISEHHKVNIPEQTVWYRMDQLNYSYKGARPHPTQGNRKKQEGFKKRGSYHIWNH